MLQQTCSSAYCSKRAVLTGSHRRMSALRCSWLSFPQHRASQALPSLDFKSLTLVEVWPNLAHRITAEIKDNTD